VGLKEESISLVERFGPCTLGPRTAGTRKGTVAHMRPPDDSVLRRHVPATPAWIVFPRFEAGATTLLRPISRPEAFLRVAYESFNYSALGALGFETLAPVIENCRCFALRYGDLRVAIEALHEVLPSVLHDPTAEGSRASR
jgi:hypothetical protein